MKPKCQMKKMVVIDGQYKKEKLILLLILNNGSGHFDPKVHGTVIQGFISSKRALRNFYWVADHTICFNYSSVLSGVDHMCLPMYDDQFRFHVHEDFESNCGLRGDLYGVRSEIICSVLYWVLFLIFCLLGYPCLSFVLMAFQYDN